MRVCYRWVHCHSSIGYPQGSTRGGVVDVPAGGGAGTFLRGDGVFATPAGGGTMSSWDVSGDSGSTETVADGNQVNFIGDTDGGILTKLIHQ
mgnify:CR=1 FL=1